MHLESRATPRRRTIPLQYPSPESCYAGNTALTPKPSRFAILAPTVAGADAGASKDSQVAGACRAAALLSMPAGVQRQRAPTLSAPRHPLQIVYDKVEGT